MRPQRMAVLVVAAALVALPVVAQPAAADIKGTPDTVATSTGWQLGGNWYNYEKRTTTGQCTKGGCATIKYIAKAQGYKKIRWGVYELQSNRDKAYNYYMAEVNLANTGVKVSSAGKARAEIIVGAHGGGMTVVDKTWTKTASVKQSCNGSVSIGLSAGLGPIGIGAAPASFNLCSGGARITAIPRGAGEVKWNVEDFQNVKNAQFYLGVKVKAGYQPDFRIDVVTPNDTLSGSTVGDRWRYQNLSTKTYCKASKSCLAG